MNRIYRLVWNRAVGTVQVASEHANASHGGAGSNAGVAVSPVRKPLALACLMLLGLASAPAFASPIGPAWSVNTSGGQGGMAFYAAAWIGGAGGTGGSVQDGIALNGENGKAGSHLGLWGDVDGGVGGLAGTDAQKQGGNGQDGARGIAHAGFGVGSGGGGGGAGFYGLWNGAQTISAGQTVAGGQGGRGGQGASYDSSAPMGGTGGGGGGGGAGGTGVINDDAADAIDVAGTVVGGDGGAGGGGGETWATVGTNPVPSGMQGGNGGDGGIGIASMGYVNVAASGQVRGGAGGMGGMGGVVYTVALVAAGSAGAGGDGGSGGAGMGMYGALDSDGHPTVSLSNAGNISGGFGGAGGAGGIGFGNVTPDWAGDGGSGGAGAYVGYVKVDNSGNITGGTGGNGGAGAFNTTPMIPGFQSQGRQGGDGGNGGAGMQAYMSQTHNTGAIVGGAGGTGGDGGAGADVGGGGGLGGHGGEGVVAMDGTLLNESQIAGGAGGQGGDAAHVYALSNGSGGTGGEGGFGAVIVSMSQGVIDNRGTIIGGAGGVGGAGAANANAGSGGNGGAGVYALNGATVHNSGTIAGGAGGNGGAGAGGYSQGGWGGYGGVGFAGYGGTLVNTGTIRGGNAGAGGAGNAGAPAGGGSYGGAGVVANQYQTIINGGTISGGLNGDGSRADAVQLWGNNNRLELWNGYHFDGDVNSFGDSTLALGGDAIADGGAGDGSFDLAQLGNSFNGFTFFEKSGSSTWTLTGQSSQVTYWQVSEGELALASHAGIRGAVAMDGGALSTAQGAQIVGDDGYAGSDASAPNPSMSGGMAGQGNGGDSAVVGHDFTLDNAGLIAGGAGGAGGDANGANGTSYTNTNVSYPQTGIAGGAGSAGGRGGSGGSGGAGVYGDAFQLNNSGTIVGGAGGRGGNANGGNGGLGGPGAYSPVDGTNGGVGGAGGAGGSAGTGGNGGYGVFGTNMTVYNTGTIKGGDGGLGGVAVGGAGGQGGPGGTGGMGYYNGAQGNAGAQGSPGAVGFRGLGGAGVVGAGGSSIFNDGTIAGGLSGDGAYRANAVELFDGGNTLTLGSNYVFVGRVQSTSGSTAGGDTLALGGTQNGTFDMAQVGTTFFGFAQYQKTGSSTWTLTNSNPLSLFNLQWSLQEGGLNIDASANNITRIDMAAGTSLHVLTGAWVEGQKGATGASITPPLPSNAGSTGLAAVTSHGGSIVNDGTLVGGGGGNGGSSNGAAGISSGIPGSAGATGNNGGTGGVGGIGGNAVAGSGFTLENNGDIWGGHGGNGGSANGGSGGRGMPGTEGATNPSGPGNNGGAGGNGGTGGNGGVGGQGGRGGAAVAGFDFTITNHGSIMGGDGGTGGVAAGGAAGTGGPGGTGGMGGISMDPITHTPINYPWGSTGAPGGNGTLGADGTQGAGGAGGVGILAMGTSRIFNDGVIGGGMSADGTTLANAVELSSGGNTLALGAGYSFLGNVLSTSGATYGGDTLALDGSTDATFDLSQIVDVAGAGTGTQFVGFHQYEKTGTSTWTLTGATASTGEWNIAQGTLVLSGDGSLATADRVTVDGTLDASGVTGGSTSITSLAGGGHVVLGANNLDITDADDTFSGVISGNGGLTVSGGTQVLTGANTYTGATIIDGGTLVLANGGSLLSAVSSTGTLVFDHSDNVIFSQIIGGTGGITQSGTGMVILNGANNGTGVASVESGTLEIGDATHEGATWGGDADVYEGGTLRGHGTIYGNLFNDGTVRPGGSVGVLTVNGNYKQTAGGRLAIDVTPTTASQLKILGNATLAGTLSLIYAPGTYTAKTYTILTANQVTGTFATVESTGAPSGISSTVNYGATNVTLGITGSGTGNGGTDPVDPTDPTDPVTVAPTDGALFANLQRAVALQGQHNLSTVLDASLLAPTTDCGVDNTSAKGVTRSGCKPGLWMQASGSNYQLDGSNRLKSTGFALNTGFDAAVGDAAHIGVEAGVGRNTANDREHGRGRVDNLHAGVYGFANLGPVVLSGVADASWGDYHFNRATGVGEAASDPNGKAYSAAIQAAWPMQFDQWNITPKLGALYQHQSLDSFHESVNSSSELASAYGVSARSSTANTLQPYAAVSFGHAFTSGNVTYVPQFEVGYRYNTRSGAPSVTVVAEDGTIFALPANRLGKGTATVGGRITATAGASWNLYLDYQGQFSGDLKDNAFSVGFTKHF